MIIARFRACRKLCSEAGGVPVMSKTGHAYLSERKRKENAIHSDEMSARDYFRDFYCFDSGMTPWLVMAGPGASFFR